ncbi:BRO-N domain-containing protein [Paenibacillus macerans]|uniref:Bro-N domain-containing protein n=1 Tax=Paenibacillus macerans TaxID=44252 RepID=A0A090Y3P5_PAEMA|nr:BRO family protein [Paenibacillus macerans]KFM93034.1 hypothetical protein DJ90_2928 [Paenibacillus macerans]MCY7558542.1 hypothetical protein [Paenibacillus macerans]MEC0153950.1 BRO family protein [Paenibacillus macerans]SUA84779.1 BRO family, N-terminal domain [Paenibacillus macerans]
MSERSDLIEFHDAILELCDIVGTKFDPSRTYSDMFTEIFKLLSDDTLNNTIRFAEHNFPSLQEELRLLHSAFEKRYHQHSLSLAKSASFGNVQCDFYSDGSDIWITREQIGSALDYSEPRKAIEKIHRRYRERLDKFSVVTKLTTTDGKAYNTYLYSAKGVYEICRWSRQPKADAFYDWVYDVLEGLRKGQLQHMLAETPKSSTIQPLFNLKDLELENRLRNTRLSQVKLIMKLTEKYADYIPKSSIQLLVNHVVELLKS